ncbi:hypothetical protein [Mycobacteroides abscessus]|uniref:hypothetical protein n=10 Tax=Mycobacteroides abscessus TaxID=36809 RepID=UPI00092C158F|nr:hypothetical protein [Mycobacteroides abscessus]SHV74322.1 Uncharacterised protein [Mycobacteroides abscessus subsp. abscessus]SHW33120.1 Uncharacterised protein [Mycobacteroides abscessus subsp. abscessus]SHW67692.1 Uncharacterised protein [Mycobacteroides abscessus subsp. abscessus]SHX16631.1 Uncharacterised protein [Mycobacteroides abscessus subsp. abscessus]SIG02650.1 Uncharacterised protein [Mycobacteroides abscessus subsp. abscessus]
MTDEISLDFDSANATVEQLLAAADRIEAEGAVSPADMATLRQQCGERYEPFLQQHFQREYAREDAYKRVAAKLRADAERKRNTIRGFEQHDEDSRARIAALDESNGIAPNGYGRMDDFQSGGTGINGPYDLNGPEASREVRPQMPSGVGPDAPLHQEPARTIPASPRNP